MAKKDYSKLSKEELLEVIKNLESKKKYGLVWDEEKVPEKVVLDCQKQLPVLKEVKEKEIVTDPNQPTHILIEGDNYHALSVLNYTHKGKIDLIYIDPPYNTGEKDFIYNDCYVEKEDSWRHSKWLNFMNKRLELAKELLADDGHIAISIDDNEVAQLKLLLDSSFNENTKIVAVKMSEASGLKMGSTKKIGNIPKYKEYVVFAKKGGIRNLHFDQIKKDNWDNEYNIFLDNFLKQDKQFIDFLNEKEELTKKDIDALDDMLSKVVITPLSNKIKESNIIKNEDQLKWKYDNSWRICRSAASTSVKKLSDEKKLKIKQVIFSVVSRRDKLIYIVKSDYSSISTKPRVQLIFASDNLSVHPGDFWSDIKTTGLDNEGGVAFKNGKKPLDLIKRIVRSHKNNNAIVLDFFVGSGTTAEAVLKLNKEDGGKRQFIACTYNEENGTQIKIAEEFCLPRIRMAADRYGGNLKYFKTAFVKNRPNKDQLKIEITKQCTEMLCLKEGIFNLKITTENYKIFEQNNSKENRYMAIFYDFANASLEELKKEMNALKGNKILYCFTLQEKLETINFKGWKDIQLESIPQKILDLYLEIFKN